MNFEIQVVFKQFDQLNQVLVDTSSLIYMHKINVFTHLQRVLSVSTIESVIEEYSFPLPDIRIIKPKLNFSDLQTDEQLLMVSVQGQIPLISEDRMILMKLDERKIPYFNTLMLLNYLRYKNEIVDPEYDGFLKELKKIARYSDTIYEYGKFVYEEIKSRP